MSHTDVEKNLDVIKKLDKIALSREVLYTSRLVHIGIIPTAAPFQELCWEVKKRCNFLESLLFDTAGHKIMDFSLKGIEEAFKLPNERMIYTVKDSMAFYRGLSKPS